GVDIDDARGDGYVGIGFGVVKAANSACPAASAASAEPLVLGLVAELGDGADDDRVHAEQVADSGRAAGIGAIGVGEILLGHHLVESGALDHGEVAVFHQAGDQKIGDAFA